MGGLKNILHEKCVIKMGGLKNRLHEKCVIKMCHKNGWTQKYIA